MIAPAPFILSLAGEYDIYNSETVLAEQLRPAESCPEVVIDFSNVTYFDSTAIGMLFRMRRARAAAGFAPAVFAALPPNVERVFKMVGMESVWPFTATLEQALEFLRSGARKPPEA